MRVWGFEGVRVQGLTEKGKGCWPESAKEAEHREPTPRLARTADPQGRAGGHAGLDTGGFGAGGRGRGGRQREGGQDITLPFGG